MCGTPTQQQQHQETRRKRHLIANFLTETKSLNCATRASTPHDRREISDLRAQGFVYRHLISSADGRSNHPNPTARSGHRVFRQRTARQKPSAHRETLNPNSPPLAASSHDTNSLTLCTSVREQWLLAGLIDKATSHWLRAGPLDGGDDEYTDTGTDTIAPDDDNDDIASFTSQQPTAIHTTSQ